MTQLKWLLVVPLSWMCCVSSLVVPSFPVYIVEELKCSRSRKNAAQGRSTVCQMKIPIRSKKRQTFTENSSKSTPSLTSPLVLALSRPTGINGDDTDTYDKKVDYNDDCFGLISLTGAVVLNDGVFTVVFVTLSLIGLLITRSINNVGTTSYENKTLKAITNTPNRFTGGQHDSKRIPAIVAAITLIITPFIRVPMYALVTELSSKGLYISNDIVIVSPDEKTTIIEVLVCSISILYGLSNFTTSNKST